MAGLNVGFIIDDPMFSSTVTLVRRASTVDGYGENVLTEATTNIRCVLSSPNPDVLLRMPEGTRLADVLTVYYRGNFVVDETGKYADVLIYNGKRYVAKEIDADFSMFSQGFTCCIFQLEECHG